MDSLKNIIDSKRLQKKEKKKIGGAIYRWQYRAVEVWSKLGIEGKPRAGWFKIFRDQPNLCERAYSNLIDAPSKSNPEKYFYWLVNDYKRVQK